MKCEGVVERWEGNERRGGGGGGREGWSGKGGGQRAIDQEV